MTNVVLRIIATCDLLHVIFFHMDYCDNSLLSMILLFIIKSYVVVFLFTHKLINYYALLNNHVFLEGSQGIHTE